MIKNSMTSSSPQPATKASAETDPFEGFYNPSGDYIKTERNRAKSLKM